MSFQIHALAYEPFARYFSMSAEELRARHALIRVADKRPGFPCRVSLEDAQIGERVLLINYEHLAATSPFRATHAIYVREAAADKTCEVGEIPELFRSRLISLRAFDSASMLLDADVVPGTEIEARLDDMLRTTTVAHVDLHFAKPGCFAARAFRA